jgi:hypothetical protein
MATKKHTTNDDAPTDDHDAPDEEAGLVPKGDTATEPDEAADAAAEDGSDDARDVPTDPNAPPPITPSSHPDAAQDRVLYENWVNSEAEAIANDARTRAIDALLAGGTVEIVVHLPDDK